MLESGEIHLSMSLARVLIFFVPKKDGSLRLCVDYQDLNLITKKNCYPLLLIGEALNCLSDVKYFTKLDICDAYHRMCVKEGDK